MVNQESTRRIERRNSSKICARFSSSIFNNRDEFLVNLLSHVDRKISPLTKKVFRSVKCFYQYVFIISVFIARLFIIHLFCHDWKTASMFCKILTYCDFSGRVCLADRRQVSLKIGS